MSLDSAEEKTTKELRDIQYRSGSVEDVPSVVQPEDVFGDEADHAIQYKTLSWQVSI